MATLQSHYCTVAKHHSTRQCSCCLAFPTEDRTLCLNYPNEEMHYDVISFVSRREAAMDNRAA